MIHQKKKQRMKHQRVQIKVQPILQQNQQKVHRNHQIHINHQIQQRKIIIKLHQIPHKTKMIIKLL